MKNKLLYSEVGGLKEGLSYWWAINQTYPFAKIKIFNEKIIIDSKLSKREYSRSKIECIEKYQGILGILGRGIRIRHKIKKAPPFIIFWSFKVDNLIKELKKAGYKMK